MKHANASKQFAICVKNDGYEVSLEKRKLYRVVPDKVAMERNLIRVIDETGQSYLYPDTCFIAIKLPNDVLKALLPAA